MPRPARPLTPESVRAAVLDYVQRFPGSVANTRRRYLLKINRAVTELELEREPLVAALEAAIEVSLRYGYLDDAKFAEGRARRALARGVAPARVSAGLSSKGVSSTVARAGIAAATEGNPQVEACAAYVRRRKLGPWRPPEKRAAEAMKDLAKVARAGFPFDVARAALRADALDDPPDDASEE